MAIGAGSRQGELIDIGRTGLTCSNSAKGQQTCGADAKPCELKPTCRWKVHFDNLHWFSFKQQKSFIDIN
jgi:hypothetical protein